MARAVPISVPENEGAEVSVRPIDNGFIVRTSSFGKDGYKSQETFTPVKPTFGVVVAEGEAGQSPAEPSRLRAAVTSLKRRRK